MRHPWFFYSYPSSKMAKRKKLPSLLVQTASLLPSLYLKILIRSRHVKLLKKKKKKTSGCAVWSYILWHMFPTNFWVSKNQSVTIPVAGVEGFPGSPVQVAALKILTDFWWSQTRTNPHPNCCVFFCSPHFQQAKEPGVSSAGICCDKNTALRTWEMLETISAKGTLFLEVKGKVKKANKIQKINK